MEMAISGFISTHRYQFHRLNQVGMRLFRQIEIWMNELSSIKRMPTAAEGVRTFKDLFMAFFAGNG
jgi:hypothetical protein